jgi:polyvinyl alcohol dehydrogenase (cytochrome)
MMGYDAKNQYFNPKETKLTVDNAASLDKAWTATIAGFPPGTPAVAEGMVFVLATGGTYAFKLSDGSVAWMKTDIVGTSSIAYEDGFLYLHANPKGQLYKLKASDGSVVWGPVATYTDVGGTDGTSSAIVADGKVFAGHSTSNEIFPAAPTDQTDARGGVFAANAETGEEVWHYYTVDLPENGAMVWSSVSIDLEAGVLYASTGDNYTVAGDQSDAIHAVDLKSGMRLWSTQVRAGDQWTLSKPTSLDTDFGANPILAEFGGKKLVAAGDKGAAFWAIDRESGVILWSREDLTASHSPANGGVLMNGAFDGKRFYVISNSPTEMTSTLFALNPEDGTDIWKHDFDRVTWGAPTVANGVLVVPVDTQLHVLDAATGDELTMFETGGSIAAGGAAIVDGKIIVQSGLQYPFSTPTPNNQVHCYALPQ